MLEKIIHYYKPYKLILLLVLIGSCFSALLELVFPYIVRRAALLGWDTFSLICCKLRSAFFYQLLWSCDEFRH